MLMRLCLNLLILDVLFNKSAPYPGFLCTSSAIALDKKICTFADG